MLILLQRYYIYFNGQELLLHSHISWKFWAVLYLYERKFSLKYSLAKKGRVQDIETEEMLEDLQGKVRELDRQNNQLKEKVL